MSSVTSKNISLGFSAEVCTYYRAVGLATDHTTLFLLMVADLI